MLHRLTLRAIALVWVVSLVACSSHKEVHNPAHPTTKTDWESIELPSRPVYVTSNANTLWVSGTDEMLAKSEDGGHSWRAMHENSGGDILLGVHFLSKNVGYAAGTDGLILWTADGGKAWKSQRAGSETILKISFADEKHGVRQTKSALEFTKDGGLTWLPIPPPASAEERERFNIDFAIAALDSKHSAVLLKDDPQGDHIFLLTNDGGKTWNTHNIPSTGIENLVVHDRAYWTFGFEVIEKDKPGGGYSVPLALHSVDGANWVHAARSEYPYRSCNAQGCILWDGAIVDVCQENPRFTAVPAEGVLTPMWAMARGGICTVGSSLKCAKAWPVDTPLPKVPVTHGSMHGSPRENLPAGCVVCPLDSLLISIDDLGGHRITTYSKYLDDDTPDERSASRHPGVQSSLRVEFVVRENGTIDNVHVKEAPTKEIESAVSNYVRNWLFEPPRQNGAPAKTQHKVLFGLWCTASPTEQEAGCLLQVQESDWSFLPSGNEANLR
jgi:TonB family protein